MNSTRGKGAAKGAARRGICGGLGFALALMAAGRLLAAEPAMPRPPELERDVQFWVRVYTEVDTNAGFLHDQFNLAVVYATLHFAPNTPPHERERLVDRERDRYAAALRRIAAAKDGPLSEDDQRIKDLWGPDVTPKRLLQATDDIRFQLGQADRFKEGLIRSGAWETHIAETLANLGLPAELAVLPHVESSFNPAAYSKVGAAGLWQFMRSTGRRYMRIDNAVDDRMDPFRSTQAAAQLLAYNYRVLGTWPLALTAYNHGAAGVRHAKETLGTDDIVKIVRSYTSRTFGFASRNFYVSFLAALEVDRNPEKYFGPIEKLGEAKFQEVVVPGFVSIATLQRVLKIDQQRLRDLNPALLRAVWDGRRHVPKAYHLRLPIDGQKWTTELLAQRLNPGELYAGQPEPRRYRVRPGDTLQTVAQRYGVTSDTLAQLNHLRAASRLRVGRSLFLPEESAETAVATVAATTPGQAATTTTAALVPVASSSTPPPSTAAAGEATNVYIVKRGDSIWEIASKVGMTEAQLLKLNGIRSRDYIFEGQQLIVKAPEASATAAVAGPAVATPTVAARTAAAPAVATPAATASTSAAPAAATRVVAARTTTAPAVASPAVAASTSAAPAVATPTVAARAATAPAVATLAVALRTATAPATATPAVTKPAAPRPAVASVASAGTSRPASLGHAATAPAPGAPSTLPPLGGGVSPEVARREIAEDAEAAATARRSEGRSQPVSAAQAEALSPALGPGAESQQSADPTDYSVAKDDTIQVAAAETLGHYADWLGLKASQLRQINKMSFGRPVLVGHKLHLDFHKVSREEFEQRRREYHQTLQANYFASHRIVGTEIYIARRGDSLWTVTQRFAQLPVWLLQQYNPDLDFADIHPGAQIVMPRVELVVANGG